MRILIFGINYAPELTGIGKYTGEMASWFANQGHDVHVLAALPYYPEWRVHPNYAGRSWTTEIIENVKVHRVPLYVPRKVTSVKRIIHEFSFFGASIPFWIKSIFSERFDAILCIAPPFHLAVMPWIYTRFRRSVWINHIQDLQVDAAKDLGMIKSQALLRIMFAIERLLLKKGTRVSTISEGMKRKISVKGVPDEKILLFPNWVDSEVIKPLTKDQSLKNEFGFTGRDKIVLYSGNLGEKQGLEVIIRIAQSFSVTDEDVKFVICGSGGGKEKLQGLANSANLKNVLFYPLQPYAKFSALLAMADVHLVLQKSSAADLVMPSKLTGILAAGGCAIVTAQSGTSLHQVVTQHNLGIVVNPEDDKALEIGIRRGLFEENDMFRANARKYAEQYLDKDTLLSKFEMEIKDLLNE
ncbi:WcaI family glycosyltransferase [Pedobacter deserti]|uniref:WcaI family glycosyltransferase n=1 Tax=Pedobacter deserti TaxID=2817382 RepID=UPI00210AC9C9|nr:WcaI family glycosyltransferase [Pedobacter sp. SYSU D00382]